jgi:YfiH family protein
MSAIQPPIVRVECPVPGVRLAYTQRGALALDQAVQGFSSAPYDAFNLGLHVGDDPLAVHANRKAVEKTLGITPFWLQQVHGTTVIQAEEARMPENVLLDGLGPRADASISTLLNRACVILTADCLPVLMASANGQIVGAAHAGWRGLADGVIEELVNAMVQANPSDCAAGIWTWLGPCIGFDRFEVGEEVVLALKANQATAAHFKPSPSGRWFADLSQIAARQVAQALITHSLPQIGIQKSDACTLSNPSAYYSYRRESKTGRMAAFIWRLARD